MLGSRHSRDRLVVCDCYTLFVGVVGPREGASAILVSLFLGAEPGGYLGLTTDSELERARAMVLEHADRRPEKMSRAATVAALALLDRLGTRSYPNFQVRSHPTVSAVAKG